MFPIRWFELIKKNHVCNQKWEKNGRTGGPQNSRTLSYFELLVPLLTGYPVDGPEGPEHPDGPDSGQVEFLHVQAVLQGTRGGGGVL